ncbi:RNA-binding component of cleavage and polyadenylation factor, partial [Coniosporium uncinatum]
MAAEVQQAPSIAAQILNPPQHTQWDFSFSDFLKREYRFGLDPNRPTCKAFLQGHCPAGNNCPDKHDFKPTHN